MTAGRRTLALAAPALMLAAWLAAGCRGCAGRASLAPHRDEARAALALLELAGQPDVGREDLARVVGDDLVDVDTPALLDDLERLAVALDFEVLGVQPLAGLERTAVDVRARLPGDADAVVSLQVARQADGAWRVVWLGGPGVEWPRRPPERGRGLSSYPPAD